MPTVRLRVKSKYWFDEIFGPLLVIPFVLTIFCYFAAKYLLNPNDPRMLGLIGMFVLMWILSLIGTTLFSFWAWKTHLEFSQDKLSGYVWRLNIDVMWSAVIAAGLIFDEQEKQDMLLLSTQQGSTIIPLKYFEKESVWELCQSYVPKLALEENSFEKIPEYQAVSKERQTLFATQKTLMVSTPALSTKITGIFVLPISIFIFYIIFLGEVEVSWVLVPVFLAIFSISCLISGKIEVNSKGILRKEFWGYCFLSWENIHHVEVSPSRGKIVFKGDGKLLAIYNFNNWRGQDKKQMLEFLEAQLYCRDIEPVETWRAVFRITKNCKIKRGNYV